MVAVVAFQGVLTGFPFYWLCFQRGLLAGYTHWFRFLFARKFEEESEKYATRDGVRSGWVSVTLANIEGGEWLHFLGVGLLLCYFVSLSVFLPTSTLLSLLHFLSYYTVLILGVIFVSLLLSPVISSGRRERRGQSQRGGLYGEKSGSHRQVWYIRGG